MLAKEKISEIMVLLESGLTLQQVIDKTNVLYTTIKHIQQNNAINIIIPISRYPVILSDQNILYIIYLITSNKITSLIDLKYNLNSIKISINLNTIY